MINRIYLTGLDLIHKDSNSECRKLAAQSLSLLQDTLKKVNNWKLYINSIVLTHNYCVIPMHF